MTTKSGRPYQIEVELTEKRKQKLRDYQRAYHQDKRKTKEFREYLNKNVDKYVLRRAYYYAQNLLALNGYPIMDFDQIPMDVLFETKPYRITIDLMDSIDQNLIAAAKAANNAK